MNTRSLSFTFLLVAPLAAQALPAFPEAQGAGATSVGGRGGVICEVTNLNDSGAGSLRACVDMKGPRIVVFRVGGTIRLLTHLRVVEPYITIAGQTAPGGGILLSGTNSSGNLLDIAAHNVIIRYIRMRKGYNAQSVNIQSGDDVHITYSDSRNQAAQSVIVDHCSMSWTQDENVGVWGKDTLQPKNTTFSWNLIAEPLAQHPTNVLTGSNNNTSEYQTDIDFHHNLLANSSHRNPLIKNKTFRFINNMVYNWSKIATEIGGGVNADIIGNLYKVGPLNTVNNMVKHEVRVFPSGNSQTPLGIPAIYITGNIGPYNLNPNNDNWIMVQESLKENGSELGPLATKYRRTSPLPTLPVPIKAQPANELENSLLPTVGASRRLDCLGNWIANRDAVDKRIVQEYQTNKGIIPATENDVGGFPTIAGGTPCTDTDHDGMPDVWENANRLNKNNPADGSLVGSDGYTNIEKYLNGSVALTVGTPPSLRLVQQ